MKKQTLFPLVFTFVLALLATACGPSGSDPNLVNNPDEASETAVETDGNTTSPTLDDAFETVAEMTSNNSQIDANGIEVGFTEDGHPYRGNRNAPIVFEEFSDYQCPFCARFFSETLPSLMENHIAVGDVMTIFYDFPLTSIHPQAAAAAHAARCAGDQGALPYWDMHDKIFANQSEWSNNKADSVFSGYAEELGLDTAQFEDCQAQGKYESQIQDDLDLGRSRGVGSTPSFFVNNQMLVGAQPLSVFNEAFAIITEGGSLPVAESEPEPAEPVAVTGSPMIDPAPAIITMDDAASSLGDPDAPVTIVEFTDYQCPYCQRHVMETLPRIVSEMIDNGRVYYVVKDFPLDSIHPYARDGAVAARCAGDQGVYWEMHEILFENQSEWVGENAAQVMAGYASGMGLDIDAYNQCVSSGRYDTIIQDNQDEGISLGVSGTPAFFINGFMFSGAQPYDTFAANVALAESGELAAMLTSYSIGDPDAPVTIVEYTDYECPFCSRHFTETYPKIKENYVDTGLVRYVFKDFPLTSIHPRAGAAAFAARCAGDQGAYEGMHDLLFAQQAEWAAAQDSESLLAFFNGYAEELEMDTAVFTDCLLSGNHQSAIVADLQEAVSFGIQGTPAFFINDTFLSGAQPYSEFERIIEDVLGSS